MIGPIDLPRLYSEVLELRRYKEILEKENETLRKLVNAVQSEYGEIYVCQVDEEDWFEVAKNYLTD